jgi:hypothetical protein
MKHSLTRDLELLADSLMLKLQMEHDEWEGWDAEKYKAKHARDLGEIIEKITEIIEGTTEL